MSDGRRHSGRSSSGSSGGGSIRGPVAATPAAAVRHRQQRQQQQAIWFNRAFRCQCFDASTCVAGRPVEFKVLREIDSVVSITFCVWTGPTQQNANVSTLAVMFATAGSDVREGSGERGRHPQRVVAIEFLFEEDIKSPRCTGRTQGYLGHVLKRCGKVRGIARAGTPG
jgi:hypothetical protein